MNTFKRKLNIFLFGEYQWRTPSGAGVVYVCDKKSLDLSHYDAYVWLYVWYLYADILYMCGFVY